MGEQEVKFAAVGKDSADISNLFKRNRAWAERKTRSDPGFFKRLVSQQNPHYFWIGCSDSRVPATEIVDLDPGEMFVHRNVANLANVSDPNFSAALEFAVDVLQVRHIIVVGHYGCGGIAAATSDQTDCEIGRWLIPVRELRKRLLHNSPSGEAPHPNALCDLNVLAQVEALVLNPIVGAAWARDADLTLHGWVYEIADGLLKRVCTPVSPGRQRGTI
ncbi:MAG: carbonic anhydrase [Parvibaculum sp.]|nr:carbonic anhydrase [Parvibaculum sp.]MCW5727417.1 carbonic anhydrase [Parvibaculum sp.]